MYFVVHTIQDWAVEDFFKLASVFLSHVLIIPSILCFLTRQDVSNLFSAFSVPSWKHALPLFSSTLGSFEWNGI